MKNLLKIEIPTTCPSCFSDLEQVNSQLFCRNKDCPAQTTKKVEAFVKKMRIKGLGPARISNLGFVRPIEIYETSLDTYVEVLGEKIGQKIFEEIQNSRMTTFTTFLSALSIPLIGNTASKKISEYHNNIDSMVHDIHLNMVGEKARQNIQNYTDEYYFDLLDLENYFTFKEKKKIVKASKGNVCITGKLNDFSNRAKAKEFLEEHGYTVTSTISGKTNYLVCEDGSNSSKSKKAESLEIPIVTIDSLIN
jgi:DNA ligase (NAD+)